MTAKFELNDKVWFVDANKTEAKQGEILGIKFATWKNTCEYDILGGTDWIPEQFVFRTEEEATREAASRMCTYENLQDKTGDMVYVLSATPKNTTLRKGLLVGVDKDLGCVVMELDKEGTTYIRVPVEEVFTDEYTAYKVALINTFRVKNLGLRTDTYIWSIIEDTRNLDYINQRLMDLGLAPIKK